jgi:hypothetical protein
MKFSYEELYAALAKSGDVIAKAQPTPGDMHVNVPLNNIVVAFMQNAPTVADKLFPRVPVSKQSDLFYKYDIDTFLRDEAKPRAPATESAGSGFTVSTDTYSCLVESFHKDVDDQLRANADSVLQLDRAAAEFVASRMIRRRESRFLATFFKTGVWGTDWTGVESGPTAGQFLQFTADGADPRTTIEAAKLEMLRTTGYEPNVGLFGAAVMSKLVTVAAVKEQFKYTSAESINESMVARYLGLDNIYTSKTVVASGIEGASATVDFIANDNDILLAYRAPAPSIMAPSAGYTFDWTGLGGGGIRTKRFRMENIASDRVESEMAYAFKVVAPSLGFYLASAVA